MSALFSTAYLPPVQYVAAMLQHADTQIETKETFPKQTYRNRALIMTAGGVRPLIVPVVRTQGNHSRTEDIAIDYRTRWNVVHLRTLEAAYAASPYYFYYKDGLCTILESRHDRLLDLNQLLLHWLLKCLKIHVEIALTTDWLPPTGSASDYRYAFSPKQPSPTLPPYYQVFSDRHLFAPDLSTLDLLFNLGPEALNYLKNIT